MLCTAEVPHKMLGPLGDFLRALQLEGYGAAWDLSK